MFKQVLKIRNVEIVGYMGISVIFLGLGVYSKSLPDLLHLIQVSLSVDIKFVSICYFISFQPE